MISISQNDETKPVTELKEDETQLENPNNIDMMSLHNQEAQTTTRKSTRERRKPNWMSDFVYQVNFAAHKNTLSKDSSIDYTPGTYPFTSPSYFSSNYLGYIVNITKIREINTYLEATNNPV